MTIKHIKYNNRNKNNNFKNKIMNKYHINKALLQSKTIWLKILKTIIKEED